jgi:hypothetical protein
MPAKAPRPPPGTIRLNSFPTIRSSRELAQIRHKRKSGRQPPVVGQASRCSQKRLS